MSDIRFNTWLHQSGTGGITQVDGGHVGIGTTNPDIAVHTANAKKVNVGIVTANSVYAGNFYGNGSNLTGLNSDKIEEGDTKVEVVDSGDQYIVGEVNGSERLRITSAGKVGIGSDNPQKNLDIYSGQSHGSIRVHNLNNGGTGYDAELSLLGSASNSEMRINMGVNSDPDREQIKSYQSNLIFTTNTDERIRIESGGGLKFTGQGTSIPVAGILHHTNNYLYMRGGTSGLILANQDNTNTININDGNYIKFETNDGSERLRLNSDGNMLLRGGSVSYLVLGSSGDSGFDATISNNMNWIRGNGDNLQLNCADDGFIAFETNGTERMRIHDSLYTSFGTTSATPTNGGTAIEGQVGHLQLSRQNTNGEVMIRFMRDSSQRGSISVSTSTTYNTTSDYRLKENVTDLIDAITRLKKITPRRFNFIEDENKQIIDGFIAHEVSEAVPESVTGEKDEVYLEDCSLSGKKKGDPKYQEVDYSKYVPLLTAALQEAVAKIETLETEVAALKSQLNN